MDFEEASRRYRSKPDYTMVDLKKKREERARAKSTSDILETGSNNSSSSELADNQIMKNTKSVENITAGKSLVQDYSIDKAVSQPASMAMEDTNPQVTHRAANKANYTEISKEMLDSSINPSGHRYEDTTISNNTSNTVAGHCYEDTAITNNTSNTVAQKQDYPTKKFPCAICVVIITIIIVCTSLGFVFSFIKIQKLQAEINSSMDADRENMNMSMISELYQILDANITMLSDLFHSMEEKLDVNMEIVNEQNKQLLDTLESLGQSCNLAASCASLLASSPSTPSGHYWVKSNNGSAVRVYCDMTRSCGGVTGGWTRVAELDTNNTTQCPGDLRYLDDTFTNNVSVCGINGTFRFGGCSSAAFSLSGILYSRVCGRIKAYQFGTPEAFHLTRDIDSVYVDGISLTHGNPRQHIWTFAADSNTNSANCPCSPSDQTTPTPSLDFVGEDYFCNTASDDSSLTYHFDNPVWNGDGCIPGNMCCSFNSPPWFYKQLPRPTTDDIEMRVCADDLRSIEDIGIESLEIYIQ